MKFFVLLGTDPKGNRYDHGNENKRKYLTRTCVSSLPGAGAQDECKKKRPHECESNGLPFTFRS